jgi:HAD superfamily hydrolase (TIGR01549 family)
MNQPSHRIAPKPSLILFDMDDTLISASPRFSEFVSRQLATLGVAVDPERERETERWLLHHWMQPAYNTSDPQVSHSIEQNDSDTYWYEHLTLHLRVLGLGKAEAEPLARELLPAIATYEAQRLPAPDAVATLDYLSGAGYRLGVLSNRLGPIHDMVRTAGINLYFELIISGGEMGFLKPDPRFFHYALDWFGCSPLETIYVGDNYYADVVGAKFAGLTPVLIDPKGVFSGADCLTITALSELQSLL